MSTVYEVYHNQSGIFIRSRTFDGVDWLIPTVVSLETSAEAKRIADELLKAAYAFSLQEHKQDRERLAELLLNRARLNEEIETISTRIDERECH